jgi:hypothetical protein
MADERGAGRRWKALVAAAVLVVLGAAGCTGDEEGSSPSASDEVASTTTTEAEEPDDVEAEPTTTTTTEPELAPGQVLLNDLVVGHCVDEDLGLLFRGVTALTLLDCAQPHRAELYFELDVPDGPYPGDSPLASLMEERCYGQGFTDYVGTPYDLSDVWARGYYPSPETWEDGDRTISCFAHEEDSSVQTTVSYRNSGR